jgi:hypothetical protein
MPDETQRPIDGSDQNEPIEVDAGEFLPIPDVGDTVSYDSYEYDYGPGGRLIDGTGRVVRVARKVKTRHYSYFGGTVAVNIVVVDVPKGEMSRRLKE